MTPIEALSLDLCRRILSHFGILTEPAPTLETLHRLLSGYTRAVPWESASRIVRRARQETATDCALLGADFWENHFESGTGGTCYESNYAFFGLLRRLGYEGYLTINDMGSSIGCHSAIILLLDGQKHLVDVGYPVHAALPLYEGRGSRAASAIMDYTVEPVARDRYMIWREIQPRSSAFQLNDKPVSDAEYRAIARHDYRHDGGQFLNEIVIHKVLDDQLWRFDSDERPFCLQQFVDGQRRDRDLGDDPAAEVADKFGIARDVVAGAMGILELARDRRAT